MHLQEMQTDKVIYKVLGSDIHRIFGCFVPFCSKYSKPFLENNGQVSAFQKKILKFLDHDGCSNEDLNGKK